MTKSIEVKKMKTSVIVCGAGPAGLTLSHLLGAQDIDVILLEKLGATVEEPRAIAIDGESLRTLQRVGLLQGFEQELLTGITADYVNAAGERLFQAGNPDQRPYGFPTVNSFDQPSLDRYLANRLDDRDSVRLLFNHTLDRFEQNEQGVTAYCTDEQGDELVISASFLVGCDGGRSTIRSLLGIEMQGESNPQPWLVIDTIDPILDSEMDCRFFCDPERPGMTIRKQHQERRWEWMLMPGEEREYLLQDETIRGLIAPYTDVEKVSIYRKRVYDFHAIIADRWREGRVFLAGDAAHMTPPFAGQGLNSGFRDVSNLSWKLAAVVKGFSSDAILDTYETERRGHAWELIEMALQLGQQIQPIDVAQAAERDRFFAELNKDPAAMQAMEEEMFKSLFARAIEEGLVVDAGSGSNAGKLLIQPQLKTAVGEKTLLDEKLGGGFAIVGYNCLPSEVLGSQCLQDWRGLAPELVAINDRGSCEAGQWLVDESGELRDWLGGDEPRLLLVRPDRICMVCAAPVEAAKQLGEARRLLQAWCQA